jgi:hypothetical protein
MLSRLNLLSNHFTSLPLVTSNPLDKYRKMSSLDLDLLDKIYFLGSKEITMVLNDVVKTDKHFV